MHQPRPYGLLAVGGELTDEDAAAVELLARRLTNLRELSKLDSLRMVRSLPDGGYVIAQNMGGNFRVITHKPPPPPDVPFDGFAVDYIPMLFSGVITKSAVADRAGVKIKLTEGARRRIGNYDPEKIAPKEVELQRFVIDYNMMVQELKPQQATLLFYTQYAAQRPTWYSGAMAEVMQIVGGYGRQKLKELPDDPVERARMEIPESVMAKIREQMGNIRLPGYTGLPHPEGQFQYDYKFNNTHGVGFGSDGKPWLLRVDYDGVWAMPLPLIPATTTEAFRDYVTEKEDKELLAILDRFGGMPSGETMPPPGRSLQAWRRAGVIIKVCEVGDFYQHISYSSACGWSFNSKGTEGFNTCYDYYDDQGLGYGLAYKLSIRLGPTPEDEKLPPAATPEDPDDRNRLNAYLASLFRLLTNDPKSLAIKYKLRRVGIDAILEKASKEANQDDVDYWDNLELEPIAGHSGSVKEVGRGYLYHPADFEFQPQIKFPEPFMGGCVSHDFLPLINGRYKDSYPNSDTIMFGYYIGDALKVVKYFRDGRSFNQEVESDFEECMIVGSWTKTVTSGSSSLQGHFYISDIDERRALAPVVEVTKITGKDRGWDQVPFFEQNYLFSRPGKLWRNRYFTRRTVVTRTEGQKLEVAICIPYLHRNAAMHAVRETTSGSFESDGTSQLALRDPTSYSYWTYHFVFAWRDSLPVMNGQPYPKDGNPVWVEMENYEPYPCSEFADGGSWIPNLPADYTWLIHPNSNEWKVKGGGSEPSFNPSYSATYGENTETGSLKVSILDMPGEVYRDRTPNATWFLGSPDPIVGVFYRDACQAVFGDAVYASVSEPARQNDSTRKHFGYTSLADHKSAHHFIGVINE